MRTETKALTILSGKRSVRGKTESPIDIDTAIRKGFPCSAGDRIKGITHLSDERLAQILGISKKTLGRLRKSRGKFSPVASDRLYRFAKIVALAIEVFGSEERASEWLSEPQFGLRWKTPLDLLTTDAGTEEVEDLLGRIKYGVYS